MVNNPNYNLSYEPKKLIRKFLYINSKKFIIINVDFQNKLFRFGYGVCRQIARRRFSDRIDEKNFKNLTSLLKVESPTIGPFNNYPDLFMTSEVLDCLSNSLLTLRGDLDIIQ